MKTFDDGFYVKDFNELDGTDEGKDKLLMEGIVMGMGDIEHYVTLVQLKCPECKEEPTYTHITDFKSWRQFTYPKKCPECNVPYMVIQSDKSLIRKFLFGEDKAANPITLTAFTFKDDVYALKPGERIRVNGTLASVPTKDNTFKRVLDIKQLTVANTKMKMPNEEELKRFKEMDKQLLLDSFAPRIKNMKVVKEGLFIALLGGVDDGQVRGDINVILMGDPGVAKTQLLKFVAQITQKSDYTSGKSSSQAGLLAGVDNLSDGTRIAKPGSVIMCNGGICCIDEFEKMNPSDRSGLHEVMENQTFSLRKVGINMTWEAKTTIFAAANPRGSRWDTSLTIKENVNLPDSLLSRFGLIFLIRDIPNQETDLEIARHIRKIKQGGLETIIEPELLTKFINHARTIKPIISDEAADSIEAYWADLRCQSQKEGAILVDNRTLQDLYRIAEAYARLDLSETVTAVHGHKAIKLLTQALHSLGMETPGQMNSSMMAHLNKEDFLSHLFKDGISEKSAILRMCEHRAWFKNEIKALGEINKLRALGLVFENDGVIKWV